MNTKIKILLLGITALMIGLYGCGDDNSTNPVINQEFNEYVLQEVNYARTDPGAYAEDRLKDNYESQTDNGSYLDLKSKNGVQPLEFNDALNKAASKYASFLANNNKFGHFENGTPSERANAEGFESQVGENLAAGSSGNFNAETDSQNAAINFVRFLIIDEGVDNLGHRINILKQGYKYLGVGYAKNNNSNYVNYFVQNFGSL